MLAAPLSAPARQGARPGAPEAGSRLRGRAGGYHGPGVSGSRELRAASRGTALELEPQLELANQVAAGACERLAASQSGTLGRAPLTSRAARPPRDGDERAKDEPRATRSRVERPNAAACGCSALRSRLRLRLRLSQCCTCLPCARPGERIRPVIVLARSPIALVGQWSACGAAGCIASLSTRSRLAGLLRARVCVHCAACCAAPECACAGRCNLRRALRNSAAGIECALGSAPVRLADSPPTRQRQAQARPMCTCCFSPPLASTGSAPGARCCS